MAPHLRLAPLFVGFLLGCGSPGGGSQDGGPLDAGLTSGFLLFGVGAGLTTFPGGTGSVRATVVRAASFTDSIQLSARSLPDGVTASVHPISATESTGAIEVLVSTGVAAGSHADIELVARGGGVEHSATVSLDVVEGFRIAPLSQTVQVRQGAQVDLAVNLLRSGGFDGGVTVTLVPDSAGPLSLSALTIPAGSMSGTATLAAATTGTFGLVHASVRASSLGLIRDTPLLVDVSPASGTMDPSFGSGGTIDVGTPTWPREIALDAAGRVVEYVDGAMTRRTTQGSLDSTFAVAGPVKLFHPPAGATHFKSCMRPALTAGDAGIDLTMSFQVNSADSLAVHRLQANGSPKNFGDGGILLEEASFCAQAVQPGGRLVVGAHTHLGVTFLGYDQHGRDPGFGNGGVLQPTLAGEDLQDLVADDQGRLVASSSTVNNDAGVASVFVQRWNPAGNADPSFGVAGTFSLAFAVKPYGGSVSTFLAPAAGGYVVGGTAFETTSYTQNRQYVCVLDSAGMRSGHFGVNGCTLADFAGSPRGSVTGVLPLPGESVLVAADDGYGNGSVLRFTPDGAIEGFAGDRPVTVFWTPTILGWSDGKVAVLFEETGVSRIQRFFP